MWCCGCSQTFYLAARPSLHLRRGVDHLAAVPAIRYGIQTAIEVGSRF